MPGRAAVGRADGYEFAVVWCTFVSESSELRICATFGPTPTLFGRMVETIVPYFWKTTLSTMMCPDEPCSSVTI